MATLEHQVFEQIQQRLDEETARKDEIRQIVRYLIAPHAFRSQPCNAYMLIPPEQIQTVSINPKFHGVQQILFLVSFSTYLKYERVPTIAEFEDTLQLNVDLQNELLGMHIPYEDVLQSFISVANELSRLAVNSVTSGDYERPRRISSFVKELMAGFQLLNMKNDNLRKRFDGVKYDLKRIEEVVYDVSLRGLTRKE
ncbi:unnamed protein product [Umbelopsis vinacea]